MNEARRLLGEALEREEEGLLTCVHCGFCLPACPTYRRLGDEADSPRGRLHLMRAVAEGRLEPEADAVQVHLDRCLGCRACEPVCPSGVPYGRLLEEARSVTREARKPPLATRLLPALMERPRLRRLVLGAARLLRATGLPALVARRLDAGTGAAGVAVWGLATLGGSAPGLGASAGGSAGGRGARGGSGARVPSAGGSAGEKPGPGDAGSGSTALPGSVVSLDGCVQADLFGRVNEATRRVLEANGVAVKPWRGQGCCGALHAHAGDLEGARRLARANIAAFRTSGAEGVCANAAGCGAAMKEYGHLLRRDAGWADEAADFSARVRDVSELLAAAGPRPGAPLSLRVAYDPPCHLLHAQGVDAPVRRVLGAIPELELVEVPRGAECCGGAGSYGLTHPELGGAIASDKVDAVSSTGASVVATGNPGCMMQIGAGLLQRGSPVRTVHPVELLAESYRRLPSAGGSHEASDGEKRAP